MGHDTMTYVHTDRQLQSDFYSDSNQNNNVLGIQE
jgi:hypothetical protein